MHHRRTTGPARCATTTKRPDERSVSPAISSTPTLQPPCGTRHSLPPPSTVPACGSTATSKATASSGPEICAESSTGGPRAEVTQRSTYRSCGHLVHCQLPPSVPRCSRRRRCNAQPLTRRSSQPGMRCPAVLPELLSAHRRTVMAQARRPRHPRRRRLIASDGHLPMRCGLSAGGSGTRAPAGHGGDEGSAAARSAHVVPPRGASIDSPTGRPAVSARRVLGVARVASQDVRRRDHVPRLAERLVTGSLKYPFRCVVEREVLAALARRSGRGLEADRAWIAAADGSRRVERL